MVRALATLCYTVACPASWREMPLQDRYFPCWTFQTGAIASALFSMVFCTGFITYMTYELNRLASFFSRHNAAMWDQSGAVIPHYDKNMLEVDEQRMAYLLGVAQADKALASTCLCASVVLFATAGLLIRAIIKKDPHPFLVWIGALCVSYGLGCIYILFDCSVYGFTTKTNFILLVWLAMGLCLIHGGRCIIRYYRFLKNGGRSIGEGVAVFQPPSANMDVFAISGSSEASRSVRIMLKPPPYEEAISTGITENPIPEDKPPDYTA